MIKIFLGTLGLVAIASAAFFAMVLRQPDDFFIERTALINAGADDAYAQVINLHRWDNWSPWAVDESKEKRSYEGPAKGGENQVLNYFGTEKVGEGRLWIEKAVPPSQILVRLIARKPIPMERTIEFKFEPKGEKTQLTWTMRGKNTFIGKLLGLLLDSDRTLGPNIERGITNIGAIAEIQGNAGL